MVEATATTAAAAAEGGLPALSLPRSGKVIVPSRYAVPARAVVMSPRGNDLNPGTAARPVRSLNRAIGLVPRGGTIVLRGGVYRDAYTGRAGPNAPAKPIAKPVTLQAWPGEQPWLDGSDPVPTSRWRTVGSGRWAASWVTPTLCEGRYYAQPINNQSRANRGPCTHIDIIRGADPAHPIPSDPQQIWIDGRKLTQVDTITKLAPGRFVYDWARRQLIIGQNPAGHSVEAARRPTALILAGKAGGLRGIGVRRYASNEFHNMTGAAVFVGGGAATISHCAFVDMSAAAVKISNPTRMIVASNSWVGNGYTPLMVNGNSRTGYTSDLQIVDNLMVDSNHELFGRYATISSGSAAMKLAHLRGFLIARNVVDGVGARGSGLWCDLLCSKGRYLSNLVRHVGGTAIFHEVSDDAVIAGNLIDDALYGIGVASANTRVFANTLRHIRGTGIRVYDDTRAQGVGGWNDIGPATRNVRVGNNIVEMVSGVAITATFGRPPRPGPNTSPGQYFTYFDHNKVVLPAGHAGAMWEPRRGRLVIYGSRTGFTKATRWERNSLWTIAGTSAARSALVGAPLPAEITRLLGLPAGHRQLGAPRLR